MINILLLFLKNYWKHLAIILTIVIASIFIYNKIYNIGYDAATVKCQETMQAYTNALNTRISNLEASSTQLVLENIENRKNLQKDFSAILSTIKGKPLYVIEQGVCKPSKDFISTYNEAVDRANK